MSNVISVVSILRPGLQTTVQDLGRWGWQARGVPVAGAMDWRSHRLANALVGNDQRTAALEIALIGPELEFADDRIVAVTGADFDLTVDGSAVVMCEPFAVARGSRVKFGERRRGARAYLAIEGGIAVPEVLGSRATHVGSRMGGHEGRALVAGDRLPLGAAAMVRLKPDTPYYTQPHTRQYGASGFSRTSVEAHARTARHRSARSADRGR